VTIISINFLKDIATRKAEEPLNRNSNHQST